MFLSHSETHILFVFLLALFTPKLKDPLMMAHHIGMLFIAGVVMGVFTNGQPRGSYYAPFFIGGMLCLYLYQSYSLCIFFVLLTNVFLTF